MKNFKLNYIFIIVFSLGKLLSYQNHYKYFHLIHDNMARSNSLKITGIPYYFNFNSSSSALNFQPHYFQKISAETPLTIIGTSVLFKQPEGNLSLIFDPFIVNSKYSNNFTNNDYERSNFGLGVNNASVLYQKNNLFLHLGKSNVYFNKTSIGSLVISGNQPSFNHFLFKINFENFSYEFLSGQLASKKINDIKRVKRFIGGRKFLFNINDKVVFGFGDVILYTGINRSLEFAYINPLSPYFLESFGNEEETITDGDNDNSMLFILMEYSIFNNTTLFSEVLIDDFQVDNTPQDNALGIKIGIKSSHSYKNKILTHVTEYTQIDFWTYLHPGEFTNWENYNHSLGFPYGPGVKSIQSQFKFYIGKNFSLFSDISYIKKHLSYINSYWYNGSTVDNKISKTHLFYKIGAIANTKLGKIQFGYEDHSFPLNIANDYDYEKSSSLFLAFDFIIDIKL